MEFQIKSNVKVTKPIEAYVQEKVEEKLSTYSSYLKSVVIKLEVDHKLHTAKVLFQLKGQGRVNSISAKSDDLYKSIDQVADKVVRKVRQHKKRLDKLTPKEETLPPVEFPVTYDFEDGEFEVAKIKHFSIKPMFIEEAIMQMNSLGHSFFFYFDANVNAPCVVYKRKNNTYGVIESDM